MTNSDKQFTGYEWLLIDIANNHYDDLDKLAFEYRIEWTKANIDSLELEVFVKEWKTQPQYVKAVMALRKAQYGDPTGHLVGVDATCSGAQIMSVLTNCHTGAESTGLVNPNRRADLYTDCTADMNNNEGINVDVPRADIKQALMTVLYGSEAQPKKIFGEGTKELELFYKTVQKLVPGAVRLLNVLRNSWQPMALKHSIELPDGFHAHLPVMAENQAKIEIDELAHSTFQFVWQDNLGAEKGLSNIANAVHATDAYVLRSVIRRCNYDEELLNWAQYKLGEVLLYRGLDDELAYNSDPDVSRFIDLYQRTGMADIVILNHLCDDSISGLSTSHAKKLLNIVDSMLAHKSFPVMTVHDAFYSHPNNVNDVRKHYKNILAELAESKLLDSILTDLYGHECHFEPMDSQPLGNKIRASQYALC